MRTLTVSLTPHQAEMMQGMSSRLKKAYDEGMASGEGREITADALLPELKAESRESK